jgi:hypothetical protein
MNKKSVAYLVSSIASLSIWTLLIKSSFIGGKTQTILILLSMMLFVYASFKLLREFKFENSYFKFIFSLFILYQFIIVLRGLSFAYNDLKVYLQVPYVFWPFVIPLFVFFDKSLATFGILFKWIYYSGIFFLLIVLAVPTVLLHRATAETYAGFFVPCGFLLLNATYLSNKKINLSFFVLLISIVSLTYLARRSSLASLLGFVMSAYFLNLISSSKIKLFRYFPIIVIICVFVLFSRSFENSKEVLFNKMAVRISEDTRSGVYERFFYDMKDNMIFGKGMNGTYYCPLWDAEVDGETFGAVQFRNIIENGYYQLMLTGGIVHLVLFVLILLPAAIKGIFMSSNQFAKACGILVFLRMIDMFFYGMPVISFSYILVWICVGVCYTTSIRNLTDDEVRTEFEKIKPL